MERNAELYNANDVLMGKLEVVVGQNERMRVALRAVSGRCTPEMQLVVDRALRYEVSDA
jgi:hypothetical protein